jgi:hypothetical protein
MSVYKSTKSPYYRYDFVIEGHRFHGSTRCETRREAETVERQHRERARERVKELRRAQTSMQLDDVAGRYWLEVGQFHAGADDTERDLARLVDWLGKTKLLTEITDADVSALVAWRRGHRVTRSRKHKKADAPLKDGLPLCAERDRMLPDWPLGFVDAIAATEPSCGADSYAVVVPGLADAMVVKRAP